METTAIKQDEHQLAQKAQDIYEHRQKLDALENKRAKLLTRKPSVQKEQLSYLESIKFGKRFKEYKNELKKIDLKIQKLIRELSALKKQAKKLLPAPGVKIKVSTYPDDDSPIQMFCVEYIKSEKINETEDQFQIQPLNE